MKNPIPKKDMRIIGEIEGNPPMYLAGDGTQMTFCTLWNGKEWVGWALLGSFMAHLQEPIRKTNMTLEEAGLKYPVKIDHGYLERIR